MYIHEDAGRDVDERKQIWKSLTLSADLNDFFCDVFSLPVTVSPQDQVMAAMNLTLQSPLWVDV